MNDIMSIKLNKQLAYTGHFAPTLNVNNFEPPENWIDSLCKECHKDPGYFDVFIGKNSTYTHKKDLTEALLLIYLRLSLQLDDTLGALHVDEKESIIFKVLEGSGHCAAGFYGRVLGIINGFYEAKNFLQLLTQVRQNLVFEVAYQMSDEVHSQNRVTAIAQIAGLGVRTNFDEDPHIGELSTIQIAENLARKFRRCYTALQIPFLLANALKSVLFKHGYNGYQKDSYEYKNIIQFYTVIHQLIYSETPDTVGYNPTFIQDIAPKYFLHTITAGITDGESFPVFVDINWDYIELCLWSQVVKQDLINGESEEQAKQFTTILELSHNESQRKQNIAQPQLTIENTPELFKLLLDLSSDLPERTWILAMKGIIGSNACTSEVLSLQNADQDTALIWSTRNNKTEIIQAIVNSEHCDSEILAQKDEEGCTALQIAAQEGKLEAIQVILDSPYCSSEHLEQKDNDHLFPLTWAMTNTHRDMVALIISSRHCNNSILQQTDPNDNDSSPLIWALKNGYKGIADAIIKHSDCTSEVLNQKDGGDCSALFWAARNGHVNIFHGILDATHTKKILQDTLELLNNEDSIDSTVLTRLKKAIDALNTPKTMATSIPFFHCDKKNQKITENTTTTQDSSTIGLVENASNSDKKIGEKRKFIGPGSQRKKQKFDHHQQDGSTNTEGSYTP